MAVNHRKSRGFTLLITVLVILLLGAIALFIYGSLNNGVVSPRLAPKLNGCALRMLLHG